MKDLFNKYLEHVWRNKYNQLEDNSNVKHIETLEEFKKLKNNMSGIIYQGALYMGYNHDDVFDYLTKVKKYSEKKVDDASRKFSLWVVKRNGKIVLNVANLETWPEYSDRMQKQLKIALDGIGIPYSLPEEDEGE